MSETAKAKARWIRDGLYDKFIKGKSGIDIGVGRLPPYNMADPISDTDCVAHDKDICDAVTMEVYEADSFDYVWASHIIEHLDDPIKAVRNWYRLVKPGGVLVILAPHRDLYEMQRLKPSKWNDDHRFFLLPYDSDPPNTFSLWQLLVDALGLEAVVDCEMDVRNEGYGIGGDGHAQGEYSIEVIITKLA